MRSVVDVHEISQVASKGHVPSPASGKHVGGNVYSGHPAGRTSIHFSPGYQVVRYVFRRPLRRTTTTIRTKRPICTGTDADNFTNIVVCTVCVHWRHTADMWGFFARCLRRSDFIIAVFRWRYPLTRLMNKNRSPYVNNEMVM